MIVGREIVKEPDRSIQEGAAVEHDAECPPTIGKEQLLGAAGLDKHGRAGRLLEEIEGAAIDRTGWLRFGPDDARISLGIPEQPGCTSRSRRIFRESANPMAIHQHLSR